MSKAGNDKRSAQRASGVARPADPKRSEGQRRRWAAHREAVANGLVVPKRTVKAESTAKFRTTMAAKYAEGYRFPRRSQETKDKQRAASTGVVFTQQRRDRLAAASRRTAAQAREKAAQP